ncbi:MAG: polysaccharide deacetylase family protein [Chloroflexota bacterium]
MSRVEDQGIFRLSETRLLDEPYPEVIRSVPTILPYFALTIDDGYDADSLVEILNIMEENNFNGTFFMIGRCSIRAEIAYPGIMKRLAENGNELGYHTITHGRPDGGWTVDWLIGDHKGWLGYHKEMLGDDLFKKAVKPYARAPWGNFSRPFLRMCEAQNLLPVSWNNDPGSYNRGQEMETGDIFLLHVREDDLRYFREFSKYSEIKPVTLSYLLKSEKNYQIALQFSNLKNNHHEGNQGNQAFPQKE